MYALVCFTQSAEFIAFTVNITAGSSGAVSLFVGAVAHDKTTGNLLVGLSGGTATGKVTKLTKTVSYQCCHSCWVFDTCCNTCTRTVGVGDTPQQLDAITGNLTLQVIQAMQVRNIAPPAEGVLSPQYPLGLVSYVSAPGQVTSGPMVRYETSSNGGLGNSLINNIKKLEKEWPILKGILKGDANKTVIAREVTDRGFSTIERQFTDGDCTYRPSTFADQTHTTFSYLHLATCTSCVLCCCCVIRWFVRPRCASDGVVNLPPASGGRVQHDGATL